MRTSPLIRTRKVTTRTSASKRVEFAFRCRWPRSMEPHAWHDLQVVDYHAVLDRACSLMGRSKTVLHRPIIRITFDYPLHNPVTFMFCRPTGFSKLDLLACIYKGYDKIYKDIAKYDVWGHGVGDLRIEGIVYKGYGDFELQMGS